MATFVLVHGACVGGWAWKKLAPLLRVAGHEVWTPTLTGLGERVHLAHPGIDLDTHVTDVVNVLAFEDLQEVALVIWSYGGMVITGVADRAPERLAQLVYLDAAVPEDGQSWYDAAANGEASRADDLAASEEANTPGFWPVPVEDFQAQVANNADREWFLGRTVHHPLATFAQPLRLGNAMAERLPRAYTDCTEGKDPGTPDPAYLTRVRSGSGWRYRELAANHLAPVTAPRETADLLLSLV
jgi:pimeloyl-ACP methyl ester carboxylesterase